MEIKKTKFKFKGLDGVLLISREEMWLNNVCVEVW
jgi:hypothetical protein